MYVNERKDRLEALIDWIRRLMLAKCKSDSFVLNVLEEEYINILNKTGNSTIWKITEITWSWLEFFHLNWIQLDFESEQLSESCKKKILQLVSWLPKINRYLFTKLSILITNKNLSISNTNQILEVLKNRFGKYKPFSKLANTSLMNRDIFEFKTWRRIKGAE